MHIFSRPFFHLGTVECAASACPVAAAPLPQVQSWPLMRRPPEVTSNTAAVCAAPQLTEDTLVEDGKKEEYKKKKKSGSHEE